MSFACDKFTSVDEIFWDGNLTRNTNHSMGVSVWYNDMIPVISRNITRMVQINKVNQGNPGVFRAQGPVVLSWIGLTLG
jgi:hypothetical protein